MASLVIVSLGEVAQVLRRNPGAKEHRFQTCYRWEDSYSDWELEFGQSSSRP